MYAELAAILAPVFVAAGMGFIWARLGRPFDAAFVTALVTNVGAPCLVASTLTRLPVEPQLLGEMAGAVALAFAAFAGLGILLLRAMKLSLPSYLPALMFPNSGNMGLPLCLFAFGEAGLALAIIFFIVATLLQFTLGVGIAAGRFDPARLLRMPLIYAVAISLALVLAGVPVPAWIANSVELMGGLTIPLMLMALGVSLAQLRMTSIGRGLVLSLARLAGGLVIGLGIGWALDLPPIARGVLAIQSGMPVAVFNYLFAQIYRRQPAEVASMVLLSTALSFVSLPLVLMLVL